MKKFISTSQPVSYSSVGKVNALSYITWVGQTLKAGECQWKLAVGGCIAMYL